MSTLKLLTPLTLNGVTYRNRIALCALTRGRADSDTNVVRDLHVQYYTERSTGGVVITEATGISRRGLGWFRAPGIFSAEQIEAWKKVTESVHDAGGRIYCQLWHMGRQGHSDLMGEVPISASAIGLPGDVTVKNHQKKPYEVPREATVDEIKATVDDYTAAAKNAITAGFDGVQLHAANGYLIDQFLQSVSNVRKDQYGGSLENRLRFLREILDSVTSAIGASRVWIRFSPNGAYGGMGSEDNLETFDAAIHLAASYRVGCVEVLDGLAFGFHQKTEPYTLARARSVIAAANPDKTTALMGNCGYTLETAEAAVANGLADFISFGRPYMSNPDLPERFRDGVALAPPPEYPDWWTKEDADGYITFPKATSSN